MSVRIRRQEGLSASFPAHGSELLQMRIINRKRANYEEKHPIDV